jgi:gamma-glutamylcyclotransferase
VLRDHKLIFPIFSPGWGGGVASLQLSHGNDVWGALYELSDDDLRTLDGHEGFHGPGDPHNLYEREHVWVELTRPEDGSVPRRLKAAAYLAHTANPSPPSRRYLDAVIRGARAHKLPDDYIAALARLPVLAEEPGPGPQS